MQGSILTSPRGRSSSTLLGVALVQCGRGLSDPLPRENIPYVAHQRLRTLTIDRMQGYEKVEKIGEGEYSRIKVAS